MSMLSALIVGCAMRAADQAAAFARGFMGGLGAFGRFALRAAPDAIALAGGALLSYGASLIYYPAGFIVGGGMLTAVGVIGSINAKRKAGE